MTKQDYFHHLLLLEHRRQQRAEADATHSDLARMGGWGPCGAGEFPRGHPYKRPGQALSEKDLMVMAGVGHGGRGSLSDRFDREARLHAGSATAHAGRASMAVDESDDASSVGETPGARTKDDDGSLTPGSAEKRPAPGTRGHPIGAPLKRPRQSDAPLAPPSKEKRRPERTPSPSATRRRKEDTPGAKEKDDATEKKSASALPVLGGGGTRDIDEIEDEGDSSHSWNLSQLDKEWEDDKMNYDKNVCFGMRIPKTVPATNFTQNTVAGMDTLNLPVHLLLYKNQKSYDFRLIANGRFCSLLCVRSLNELYLFKSLMRVLRDRNFNVDVKELVGAVARDKGIPEPRVNAKRKEVMEILVQDYLHPRLLELVSGGRSDPQVSTLTRQVAELQRQLAAAKGADATAAATEKEEPGAITDHVEKFRRPDKMAKSLQGKFSDNPNTRNVASVIKNMSLTIDQQKEMAGYVVELKHITTPNKGSSGETVISPAEAQATQKEIRKIVADWGLPARFLGAANTSVPNTVLGLLAMCTSLAKTETPP